MVNIYVGNLPYSTTESELESLFSQFGAVIKASVVMDRDTGRSRGFGFIEMEAEDGARQAIEALHGQSFNGRPLTVNEARPRTPRDAGDSSHAGGGYSRRER